MIMGEYSCGVFGFWIENGELIFLVFEVMIVLNLKDMFMVLMLVSDIDCSYGMVVLMIVIENMMLVGK